MLSQAKTTNASAVGLLGLAPDAPLLQLTRIRLADGEPLAHDEVWLPYSSVAALAEVDFSETALYKELRERCGITLDGGREELTAGIADGDDERLLGCGPREPVLRIRRLGFHNGAAIEVRHSHIRGDRYAVTTRFGSVG